MIANQEINYTSDLIQKRDLVFFTGAGISILSPSNLIMFNDLQNKIIWALCQNLDNKLKQTYEVIYDEIDKDEAISDVAKKFIDIPPEYIFECCKKDITCNNANSNYYELEPLNSFKKAKPNLNHLHLARFLLTEHIPAILTTNFDLLIESGADKLSHSTKYNIQINKHWRWEHFKNKESPVGQYFKLHGCIEDFESIVMSLDDIGKRCIKQLPAFKYYLENYHVFFAGYRGADLDIFSYLETTQCKGIIWNGYTEDAIIPKVRHLLEKQKAKVIMGDVSGILNEISLKLGLPKFNLDETQRYPEINFLNDFFLWADKIEPISKIIILGDLWDYIGERKKALTFFHSGYDLAQKSYNKHIQNLCLSRLASIFYKINEYGEVKNICNLTLDNAKDFPVTLQLYEYIHSLQMLGLVESHTDLKKSIELYRQALAYQEKLEKIDPLSRHKKAGILINVANVFYRANLFDDSEGWYKSALKIYDEFGDVQGRASILACIGNILLKQEKYDDCLSYYKGAEYLFNETGDIVKLSTSLQNISIAYFKNNNKKEAKRYAEKSLVYHEIISDQEGCNKAKELLHLIND